MLTPEQFCQRVDKLPVGKRLPDAIYLHRDALQQSDEALGQFVQAVATALKIPDDGWNVIKLGRQAFRVSLLHYPTFFSDAYPTLHRSITVDLAKLQHRIMEYREQENPPILHRKEQMVLPTHPDHEAFCLITQEGEAAGLYAEPRRIGFKQSWERLISRHGYTLVDGRLFRNSMLAAPQTDNEPTIDRHKTALVRYELSSPMKALAKHGYLSGDYSLFDYGCGRGDDLRELEAHGIDALGWDPNFRPEGDKVASALVNLGYVINVIEDRDERIEALLGAWALADTLLVVSAMLGSEEFIAQFKPYKDGIITSRNTFQKYFNQSELRGFIERTLDELPIAIAPGIFFVFKDKLEEQRFLSGRQKRHHGWQQLSTPRISQEEKKRALLESHHELFNEFWQQCLSLGRVPANEEFVRSDELRALIGSHRHALLLLTETESEQSQQLAQARAERIDDLLVYFALNLFDKRKPYTQLPDELKRDIKAFFGDYRLLQQQAVALLYAIASPQQIAAACQLAHQQLPASLLFADHSLLLHKGYINELPALLRVYVGAASQLYGELDEIDVVKIHIQSGKVSLMGYDDFEQPIPYLRERVKIKMAEQDVDFFDYVDEQRRPPLLNKSYLLPKEHPDFAKQRSLEQRLGALLGMNLSQDLNLSRIEFEAGLNRVGKMIKGFRIHVIDK